MDSLEIGPYLLLDDASNGTNSSSNRIGSAHRKLLLQFIFVEGIIGLFGVFVHIEKFDDNVSPCIS